jgi:hypothetical protein
MAKPAKKNQSRFGEAMGTFMPTGLAYRREGAVVKPSKPLPWTEIGIGALCLVLGFGLGLYLVQPHGASVATTTATPSAAVATFGSAGSVLKPVQAAPVATSSATTLQPGQIGDDLQGAQVNLQPQPASITTQGTVSSAQLQGSINGPVAVQ